MISYSCLPAIENYESSFVDKQGTTQFSHSKSSHIISCFCACIPYTVRRSELCDLCWARSRITMSGSKEKFILEEMPVSHVSWRLFNCSERTIFLGKDIVVKDAEGKIILTFQQGSIFQIYRYLLARF